MWWGDNIGYYRKLEKTNNQNGKWQHSQEHESLQENQNIFLEKKDNLICNKIKLTRRKISRELWCCK